MKTANFWLTLGAINHGVALLVLLFGCAYSNFTCQGDSMKAVLSTYAFTLFTPQLALAAIILMAVFLITSSLKEFRQDWRPLALFLTTFGLLALFSLTQYR